MSNRFSKLVLAFVIIFVLVILSFFLREFFTIDACLDRGGMFDYQNKVCIENNQLQP